jgi:magnesium transporter
MLFSMYGMNFKYMPELESPYGYPIVLGITLVGCTLLHVRLKRAGWL